jgi:hypothetical protein
MLGLAAALALGGCDAMNRLAQINHLDELDHPGALGRLIDQGSPPVTLAAGGPSGVLVTGPYVTDVPDLAVNRVIAAGLTDWLTFNERRNLAMASERAAAAATGASVAWESHDGTHALTVSGGAVAVGDVFRSHGGSICRDVRQSFAKGGTLHAQTVTLCRDQIATGVTLWLVADIQ